MTQVLVQNRTTGDQMIVRSVQASPIGSQIEFSAEIGQNGLWYQVPAEFATESRSEPFVVAGVMPAMARRENLKLDPELRMSPRLLGSLTMIQQILNAWVPALHSVQVVAHRGLPALPRPGAICFFSGGVDSAYSYLKNADDISYLVLIHGLDIHADDEASFTRALQRVRKVADGLGKSVIPVRTNAREFCKANGLTMVLFHGALLASVALLLGFERSYIPASQTYWDLDPWGSHALLDPLWSTEASQIIYDGAEARRIDKVRAVARHPDLLASLRVCAAEGQGSNCGECEKCLLTMLALRLVGAKTPILPALDLNRVKKLKPTLDNLEYYLEMHDVAQQVGDLEVEKLLRASLRNFELRQILKRTDALLLGGRLRKLFGKRPGPHAPLLRPQDVTNGDMDEVQAARLWRTDVSQWGAPGRSQKPQ